MGSYKVWALTSEAKYEDVIMAINPYDEENDIPGSWPGMSYDYCEVLDYRSAREVYKELRQQGIEAAPLVLVTPRGQIHLEEKSEGDISYDLPRLVPGGYEEMLNELAEHQGWNISSLHWHG